MTRVRDPLSDLRQRRATAVRIVAQFDLAIEAVDDGRDEPMEIAEEQKGEFLFAVARLDREIAAMVRRDA